MYEGLPKPCPNCRTTQLARAEGTPAPNPRTCPQCRGVWLETGEPGLREVVELPAPAAAIAPPAEVEAPAVPYVPDVAAAAVEAQPPATDEATIAPDPEPAAESDSAPDSAHASPLSWLPPVSESMPDPRPMSRRGGPLTAEAGAESAAVPPQYLPRRWCPQCRRAFQGEEVECPACRTGLAEGGFRVQCLRCGNENTIAADRCWNCHGRMHPDPGEVASAPPPPLPTASDLRRWKRQGLDRPPPSSSCGAVMLWLVGGCLAAAAITLLLER
jgi:hypothetical protein